MVVVSCQNLGESALRSSQLKTPTLAQKVSFLAYTARFGKSYSSTQEFNQRFQNWLATDRFISNFDAQNITLSHNKFSDWSEEERNGVLNHKLALELQESSDLSISEPLSTLFDTVQAANTSYALTATSCPAGQFLSGTKCVQCPVGCKTCISSTFCTACLTTNFVLNSTSKLCTCTQGPINTAKTDCTTCSVGSFFNRTSNLCVNCLSGCSQCNSTTFCNQCANNYQFIGGKCVCNGPLDSNQQCQPCAPTEFFGATCRPCPGNCTSCSSPTGSCTGCSPSYTLAAGRCICNSTQTLVNGACVTAIPCTAGSYNLNNTCTPCTPFCAQCISSNFCTRCVNSLLRIVNSTDSVPCFNCDPTFLNTPIGSCRCQPNQLLVGSTCKNITKCTVPATYNSGDDSCLPCEAGCAECANFTGFCFKTTDPSLKIDPKTGRIMCLEGQYQKELKCIDLVKCPLGQYNDGQNTCLDCVANCDVCANFTGECLKCRNTYTLTTEEDATSCNCLTNQYVDLDTTANSGDCIDLIKCSVGFYNPGWNNCTACVQNCADCQNPDAVCKKCLPTFTLMPDDSCACDPDPTKQFLDADKNQCVDIITPPDGYYNDGINNILDCPKNCANCDFMTGICTKCNETFTLDDVANNCHCLTGEFMTATKNGACRSCPSTLCSSCQDITGNCLTCVNNLGVNTAVKPNTCGCPPDNYLTITDECTPCTAADCKTCADGTGLCKTCKDTYTLTSGSCACLSTQALSQGLCTEMIPCDSGYYNPGNNECQKGPANCTKVAPWTGKCSTCNNTFTYVADSNQCVCDADKFMNAAGLCQTCPQNCTACDKSGCTACASSFTLQDTKCACNSTSAWEALVNGACTALSSCSSGQYNSGVNTCLNCPVTYCGSCNNYNGQCTACQSGFTANRDSNQVVQSCTCNKGSYMTTAGQCQSCPSYCTSCANNTGECLTCADGSTLNLLTKTCNPCSDATYIYSNGACVCPSRTFKSTNGQCIQCPGNCTTCTDLTGLCSVCASSYTINYPKTGYCACDPSVPAVVNNVCTALTTCARGKYNPGNNVCYDCPLYCNACSTYSGTCTECKTGFKYDSATNSCKCTSTQYVSAAGSCTDCPANCTTCSDTTGACTSCQSSFTLTSTGQCTCQPNAQALVSGKCVAPVACSVGQYNPGNNVCADCSTDCISCQDFTGACTQCRVSFVSGSTPQTCACPARQFKNQSSICEACPSNCTQCTSLTACSSCDSTFSVLNGVCQCPTSQYMSLKTGTCVNCPNNCTACQSGTAKCTTCSETFDVQADGTCSCNPTTQALVSGRCTALTTCPVGQFNPGTNVCKNCPTNCYSCSTFTGQCNQCMPTFTFDSTANTCTCTSKQYKTSQNICTPCPQNCTTCADSSGACTGCVDTFSRDTPSSGKCGCVPVEQTLINGQCLQLTNCDKTGTFNPGTNVCQQCPVSNCKLCSNYTGVCQECLPTFTLQTTAKTCNCLSSQFLNSANMCQTCPQNCTECLSPSGACSACSSTFTLNAPSTGKCGCAGDKPVYNGIGCDALIVCPDLEYNLGNNTCKKCPANAQSCADKTGLVTACMSSFTYDKLTNTCKCNPNQYLKNGICTDCTANCSACADLTGLCTKCTSTTMVLFSTGDCGCLSTQTLINGQCVAIKTCPSGQYNPGNNVCQPCASSCSACQYWTGACTSCKFTFNFNRNNGTCACLSYQFLNQTNSTTQTCIDCPLNCTTCIAPKGACKTCVTSFTLSADKCSCSSTQIIIKGVCTEKATCPTGSFNDGQNNCLKCSPYCDVCQNSTSCTTCKSTFLLKAGTCACKTGEALVNGACSSTFTVCPTGQYNLGNNTCGPCPANCTACNNTGYCSACKSTFTTNTPSLGMCGCKSTQAFASGKCTTPTTCSTGKYNPGNNVCTSCSSNCTACTSPTGACSTCKSTFTLSSTKQCVCNATQALVKDICTTLQNCTTGNYNLGNNTCASCVQNCASCTAFTGQCTKCSLGHLLVGNACVAARLLEQASCGQNCDKCDQSTGKCLQCNPSSVRSLQDPFRCEDCEFPVGPIGSATMCLRKLSNSDRLVPEFKETDLSVDWRSWNVVANVKDQGKCGGDFAFSTTAAAETAYAIKTGRLYDLSEQYLIDCDVGSFGCNGGFQSSSNKLLATEGAVLEQDYPYVGTQTGCRGDQVDKVFQLKYPGSEKISTGKEAFKSALRRGSVNISFRVSHEAFFFYKGGILPGNLCPAGKLNHAMLAVGYGVEDSVEYALIQNQWGVDWGEQGLIRVGLTDDKEGPCGLYLLNSLPIV